MENSSPVLGSVCPPPELSEKKKRLFIARCPGCGNGPYVREIGGRAFCSELCQSSFLKVNAPSPRAARFYKTRKSKEEKRDEKREKKRRKKNRKKAKRREYFRERVEREVLKILESRGEVEKLKRKSSLERRFGKTFYTSKEWIGLRYEAIKRSNGICEACGKGKKDGVKLHVDHIKPRSKYPELELYLDNLQVLCQFCNLGKSNKDETDWRIVDKV